MITEDLRQIEYIDNSSQNFINLVAYQSLPAVGCIRINSWKLDSFLAGIFSDNNFNLVMKKIIKRGKLYWFYLDVPDIDDFFLVRLFRKFKIFYIPFTLRFYEKLFLREDHSKYSRKLIEYCRKNGIITYVVQEGSYSGNPSGHVPLYADYFVCLEKDRDWWIAQGIPKERIKIHFGSKKPLDYNGVVFLHPFYTRENFLHPCYPEKNAVVMKVLCDFLKKDVVFKLHPKNKDLVRRLIPENRIVEGEAISLIKIYKKIYCFSDSSIRFDCEMLGKKYKILGKKGEKNDRRTNTRKRKD